MAVTPLVIVAFALAAVPALAEVPTPAIEAVPSPAGAFVASTSFDLASVGYEQAEYFVSGTASAYTNTGPLGDDGVWAAAPSGTTADYKTRVVVYRPTSRKRFRGTVFVEWLNVSGGVDAAPDWTQGHVELIRQGAAWVGVSAQFVGVEGGTSLLGLDSMPLKEVNPARYGSLHHPGDSFSYDMFAQAGQVVRQAATTGVLGGLEPKRVIAIGESQSAGRLTNYVNAVHPLARVYDGFLIHSRGGFPTPLSESPQPAISPPGNAAIRADVDVPVLTFETETDVTLLQYFGARQDDSAHFRLWEVAGTAHYDAYGLGVGMTDLGKSPDVVAPTLDTTFADGFIHCDTPVNSGPQHFVLNAALNALVRWVRTGKAPKSAPRLDASAGPPVTIDRDAAGNAMGGIRTPQVDVPIAAFTGVQGGSVLCVIFGTTTLFDDATLAARYPTHKTFTKAYKKAARRSLKAGWLLKPDARLMKRWAASSAVGGS